MTKHFSWIHHGPQTPQAKMGDDSGKVWTLILQIHYVFKMDNRLHYVSLQSNVKRTHKRKEERDSATIEYSKWTLWLSDGLLSNFDVYPQPTVCSSSSTSSLQHIP